MVLAMILSLGTGSCELVEKLAECLCTPTTGNAKIDAFFTAAAELEAASARVESKINGAVGDLAVTVGLDRSASAAEVSAAVCDAFASASITMDISYEPPECKASVDVAAKAAAECDVTVDPGSVEVQCQGSCEGTCRASCSGECRMPSVSAYCEGSCHGSCSVDVDAQCYGTCHGTCSGTCSAEDGSGNCAGSCEGTCQGKCETNVEASCSGECHGECTVTADPGGCNGRCEGTCQGHCEGSCTGSVEPPSVDAECQAQVEAKVEASVECEPPSLDFGVDTSAVENISQISYQLGQIFAATAEAEEILDVLGGYISTMGSAAGAMISGELSVEQAACAISNLDTAVSALGTAQSSLNSVASISVQFMGCS
jgi:hypothetical protein